MINIKSMTLAMVAALILGIGGLLAPVNSAEASNYYKHGYSGKHSYHGGYHDRSRGHGRSYYPGPNRQHHYGYGRSGYGYNYKDDHSQHRYRKSFKPHGYKGSKHKKGGKYFRSYKDSHKSHHGYGYSYPLLYGLKALLHHDHH